MPLITLTDLNSGDVASVSNLNDNLDTIGNLLNGQITNENISTVANIDPSKIANGGAVTKYDLTIKGTANKIPTVDSSGNVTITGKLIFYPGLI